MQITKANLENRIKVFVYFNLHKKCWSVKAMSGSDRGRVIDHSHAVALADGVLKVSHAGRQRVLNEKCKNVHAGCQGEVVTLEKAQVQARQWVEVTYNPYKYESFVLKSNPEIKVDKFKYCRMMYGKVFISFS